MIDELPHGGPGAADAPSPPEGPEGAGPPHQAPKDDAGKGDRPLLHGEWNILPVA